MIGLRRASLEWKVPLEMDKPNFFFCPYRQAVDGEVSMLFNNAGIMPCKAFLKHSPEDLERLWGVNVNSHFWTLNEFLPDFIRQKRGHVVCLSSTAGRVGTPFLTAYW